MRDLEYSLLILTGTSRIIQLYNSSALIRLTLQLITHYITLPNTTCNRSVFLYWLSVTQHWFCTWHRAQLNRASYDVFVMFPPWWLCCVMIFWWWTLSCCYYYSDICIMLVLVSCVNYHVCIIPKLILKLRNRAITWSRLVVRISHIPMKSA